MYIKNESMPPEVNSSINKYIFKQEIIISVSERLAILTWHYKWDLYILYNRLITMSLLYGMTFSSFFICIADLGVKKIFGLTISIYFVLLSTFI